MPLSIPLLSPGTLTASGVNSIFTRLEEFLNGGISKADIDTSTKWVKERHIVRPEFYGAPSPRTLLASSDVHVRYEGNNQYTYFATNDITRDFIAIPSLSATIYADLNQDEGSTCLALVHACWFCLEKEALGSERNSGLDDGSNASLTSKQVEADDALAATFALFVNGSEIAGTRRYLYWNYDGFAFKNHSVCDMITLNRGYNDVSIRVKPEPNGTASPFNVGFYQILIRERNMHIEVIYR
jgi:hypothetical protein|tara:strand:+ start:2007 stop:2729 length:723 start_codon:yes stop_codon:yes gene_type:complete